MFSFLNITKLHSYPGIICLSVFLSFVIVSQAVAQSPSPSIASNSFSDRYEDGTELIYSITIKNIQLGEVIAIKKDGVFQVELAEFADVLEFPIERTQQGYEGWFIRENNKFSLDLSQDKTDSSLEITAGEEVFVLAINSYSIIDGSVYIALQALSDLFKLNLTQDFENLTVNLVPSQKLPIQERLERESGRLNASSRNESPIYPQLRSGYRILSPQSLDVFVGGSVSERINSLRYSVLGGRDIALVNARFFISGFDDDLVNVGRLLLSRESVNKDMLGFMGASRVLFGDVSPVRIPGLGTSAQGRGLYITNNDLSNNNNFDVTTLAGEIKSDWDVELYRNGVIIDRLINVQVGRYEFNDIPLLFGSNQLELRFFGPQGERYSETYQKIVDGTVKQNDSLNYEVSITQGGRALLTGDSIDDEENSGYTIDAKYSKKVSSDLVLSAGHSSTFGSDDDKNILAFGASGRLLESVLWNVDFAGADNGGQFIDTSIRSGYNGHNFRLSYRSQMQNELSKKVDVLAFINNGNFSLNSDLNLSYQNSISHNLSDQLDDELTIFSNAIGFRLGNTQINNRINYTFQVLDGEDINYLDGSLGLQGSIGGVFTRASLNYSNVDKLELLSGELEANWDINQDFSTNFRYIRQFEQQANQYNFALAYKHELFYLGLNAYYNDLTTWNIGLNARFSIGYEGTDERLYYSKRPQATRGTIYVRAFIDANQNAIYDENEDVIEGLAFEAVQSASRAHTNNLGVAMLENMHNQKQTDITFDERDLPDPFLAPLIQGISITPRAGLSQTLDFPFVMSSEVEGIVAIDRANGEQELLGGASVELTHIRTGQVISVKSAFDGYFYFTKIIPGEYHLSISDVTQKKYKKIRFPSKNINVTAADNLFSGAELIAKELNFLQGYITKIGLYERKSLARIYANRIQQRSNIKQIRLLDNIEKDKIIVSTGFFQAQATAEAWCQKYSSVVKNCEVMSHTIITD